MINEKSMQISKLNYLAQTGMMSQKHKTLIKVTTYS